MRREEIIFRCFQWPDVRFCLLIVIVGSVEVDKGDEDAVGACKDVVIDSVLSSILSLSMYRLKGYEEFFGGCPSIYTLQFKALVFAFLLVAKPAFPGCFGSVPEKTVD